MNRPRNIKGQYTTNKQTYRSLFAMFIIYTLIIGVVVGVNYVSASVETWTDETIADQDARMELPDMMIVEVQDTTCNMDKVDVAMWYMTNQDVLLHTEGVENQAVVLEASNQMTRDIIYCAELINNDHE